MLKFSKSLPYGLEILDDNITVRKTATCSEYKTFYFMEKLISHFTNNPDPTVVTVSNFKILQEKREQYNYKYSYDMKRLGLLSIKEKELIDFVGDMYDMHNVRACEISCNYPHRSEFLELFSFLHTITSQGRYWDIHSGNIMKDEYGYKLVDLEGFLMTPLEQPKNDWIIR